MLLWLGASSGLTQSYFNAFPDQKDIIAVGLERIKPKWLPKDVAFVSCDLTVTNAVQELTGSLPLASIKSVIISIRPPLVSFRANKQAWMYAEHMLQGLETVLSQLQPNRVLHVSSIAAVDHLRRQVLLSEETEAPPSGDLVYPYDRFKRACEEMVDAMDAESTNLRLGAIFTDSAQCIQCASLSLQSYTGPLLSTKIDCNSGRNSAMCIQALLTTDKPWKPVYYYTRATKDPVQYGEYLTAYRTAHGMRCFFNLPEIVVTVSVTLFHALTWTIGSWCPYLQSIDYLLQVTKEEHTFDCRLLDVSFQEESIVECFRRRRQTLK